VPGLLQVRGRRAELQGDRAGGAVSWFHQDRCREVLHEGGFDGGELAAFGRWLGGAGGVVSNGWWLLWTMLVHKRELCWGAAVVEEADEGAGEEAGEAAGAAPGTSSSLRRAAA
jgi:hypothetical protein